MVYMIESQIAYVIDALRDMDRHGADTVEVREDAAERFNADLDERMQGTVWNTGCASWYLDETGRNATLWPDWTWRFRQRTARFDPADFELTQRRPATARAGDRHERARADHGRGGRHRRRRDARAARARRAGRRPRPRGRRGGDVIACDVTRPGVGRPRASPQAIERLGGLDVLINNAGVGIPQSAGRAPDERRARGARRQPDRPVARDRRGAARAARVARARGQRRLRPRPPRGPVRDRLLHEQARPGRLLRRAAARARRRDRR